MHVLYGPMVDISLPQSLEVLVIAAHECQSVVSCCYCCCCLLNEVLVSSMRGLIGDVSSLPFVASILVVVDAMSGYSILRASCEVTQRSGTLNLWLHHAFRVSLDCNTVDVAVTSGALVFDHCRD